MNSLCANTIHWRMFFLTLQVWGQLFFIVLFVAIWLAVQSQPSDHLLNTWLALTTWSTYSTCWGKSPIKFIGTDVTNKVQTPNKVQSVINKVQSGSMYYQGASCQWQFALGDHKLQFGTLIAIGYDISILPRCIHCQCTFFVPCMGARWTLLMPWYTFLSMTMCILKWQYVYCQLWFMFWQSWWV